jgi:hypothetical protein
VHVSAEGGFPHFALLVKPTTLSYPSRPARAAESYRPSALVLSMGEAVQDRTCSKYSVLKNIASCTSFTVPGSKERLPPESDRKAGEEQQVESEHCSVAHPVLVNHFHAAIRDGHQKT